MITGEMVNQIFIKLISDEALCRLLAYGINPLGDDKDDIVTAPNHEELMEEIIKFSPQISNIEDLSRTRVCLYKGYTKLRYLDSATIQETIQMDIYVPFSIVGRDGRVYQIENKVVALLDKMGIGIGYLDYSEGQFVQLPAISGYAQYKMIFVLQEGRPNYARH
jgi:hypothetical protein